MDSMDGLFLSVPTTNPKPPVPSFQRLWVTPHESLMPDSREHCFTMFSICPNHCSVAYDCSVAKKRRAEEQALGVPVNKRKSLLMKPRHYSPNLDCKAHRDDRTEDDGLVETSDHSTAGSKKDSQNLVHSLAPKTQSELT